MTSPTARSVVLLCLLSGLAFGQEKRAWQVPPGPGEVVLHPNWVYTPEGKARVDARLTADAQEIAQLRKDKAALEAQPALTWKGAAILVGVGILLGGSVALVVRH